ncbi:MAG: ATP-dependent helicase HrpB [Xanthomonadales bacterium]|nr:ATP-dependent helicase HrpB [Xanthomonadales bacterium]
MSATASPLPVESVLGDLDRELAEHNRCVLRAEPGAGKSTIVPLHLLDAPWLEGRRIVMLEPRRIAARNLAAYLAEQLGESIGERVGLQVRDERRIGPRTRLELVTEGILTRRLQGDPELGGIGLVIFDEFHERHLQTDLALALALDAQNNLRPDLRILLMSATVDAGYLAGWLDASAIECEGRRHPIDIRYRTVSRERFDASAAAAACHEALDADSGDVLTFLPGRKEIHQVEQQLAGTAVEVCCLYGALPLTEQRRALRPGERRRVVLATNIAESSLTVPGITAVVDSGLERAPQFDPRSGLTHLVTRRVSAASADQRAGRAGRLAPGMCFRLWSPEERLETARPPEISASDLSGLVLELKAWGCEPDDLNWLDPPNPGAYAQAEDLLVQLGALDSDRRMTGFGRAMLRWGTEPRLAALLETAGDGELALACDLAALLEGHNPLGRDPGGDDLHEAWTRWNGGTLPRPLRQGLDRRRDQWRRRARIKQPPASSDAGMDRLLVAAYPDRIARRRGSGNRFLLANGRGVSLRPDSGLAGSEWLVVCDAALETGDSPVRWGARLDGETVSQILERRSETREVVEWNETTDSIQAERHRCIGAIVVEREAWEEAPPEAIARILMEQVRKRGLALLGFPRPVQRLRERMATARFLEPEEWPDWSDAALLERIDDWLLPYVAGKHRLSQLRELDFKQILLNELGWDDRQRLDAMVPEQIEIPSGRRAAIDYSDPQRPALAVKLQEMFGCRETPAIGNGRLQLTVELLSPAGRPLQVTQDLAHFWAHGYPEVRKEMRGRYPKHPWPEDPLQAEPTAKTKKALDRGR